MLLRLEGLEGGVCQVGIVEGGGVAGIFVGYGEERADRGLCHLTARLSLTTGSPLIPTLSWATFGQPNSIPGRDCVRNSEDAFHRTLGAFCTKGKCRMLIASWNIANFERRPSKSNRLSISFRKISTLIQTISEDSFDLVCLPHWTLGVLRLEPTVAGLTTLMQ